MLITHLCSTLLFLTSKLTFKIILYLNNLIGCAFLKKFLVFLNSHINVLTDGFGPTAITISTAHRCILRTAQRMYSSFVIFLDEVVLVYATISLRPWKVTM